MEPGVIIEPKRAQTPLRSMLIIGGDEADARDFIGDATTTDPRKLKIPDSIWPRDEVLEGVFCSRYTIPPGSHFDIVVVTARAGDGRLAQVAAEAGARLKIGGHLWLERPASVAIGPGETVTAIATHAGLVETAREPTP